MLIGIIIPLLFCAAGFATISDYGINWDFGGHFYRGEAYLRFFLTGELDYTGVPEQQRCRFQTKPFKEFVEFSPNNVYEGHHPSLGGILSALGCEIFYKRTRLLDQIDAHHALFIVLSSLALLGLYFFCLEAFDFPVALFSTLFLALFPRFVAHAHNNFKDIPVLCFLLFSVWFFWRGVRLGSGGWIVLAGVFWGLSLSAKLSGYYMPFVLLAWFFLVWRSDRSRFTFREQRGFWLGMGLFGLAALLVVFLLWPYLWYDLSLLPAKLHKIFGFYNNPNRRNPAWKPYYVLVYTFLTTPLPTLVFAGVGFVHCLRKWDSGRDKGCLLFLGWFVGAVLAFSVVKVDLYNGIRHFLSLVPALCVLAGVGACRLLEFFLRRAQGRLRESLGRLLGEGLVFAAFIPLLVSVVRTHPFQITFFNSLIGGLKGARQFHVPFLRGTSGLPGARDYWGNPYTPSWASIPEATDYWGGSYRVAVRWLNRELEPGALLAVYYCEHVVSGAGELRPDIRLTRAEEILRQEKSPGYFMFIPNRWYDESYEPIQYCYKRLKPYRVFESQGAPVVLIYKLR